MDRPTLGAFASRVDAASLLDVAKRLLDARDLAGCKTFAERAMEADPLLDGLDWVMATTDVLLAAQRRRINNHADLYGILQIDPSPAARSPSAVRLQFSRLARLLHPRNRHHGYQPVSGAVNEAFKLVCDAWAVLSDPVKKEIYDQEINIADAAQQRPNGGSAGGRTRAQEKEPTEAEADGGAAFWTACTSCFKVYQYAQGYESCTLICQNCKKAFRAEEMPSPPPIVPGTDMYYCAWGLFPLGFPGGPAFNRPGGFDFTGLDIHAPVQTCKQTETAPPVKRGRGRPRRNSISVNTVGGAATGTRAASSRRTRSKTMAKKPGRQAIGAGGNDMACGGEMVADPRNGGGAQLKEGVGAKSSIGVQKAGCSRTVEVCAEDLDLNFTIDIDATNSILESLSTLPFLKDDDMVVCGKIPGHLKGNV